VKEGKGKSGPVHRQFDLSQVARRSAPDKQIIGSDGITRVNEKVGKGKPWGFQEKVIATQN
jgi:hypothetical protein